VKIITIIGARPQFIKAATVSRAIQEHNKLNIDSHIEEIIIHTGQHYDANMSDVFFDEMKIPRPHKNLKVGSGSHGATTGKMLERIESVLLHENPDWVLVYGDTNSTLAGALAAKKLHIKLAHIEAGLRSYNMLMPEEQNRIITDRLSDMLFCPTETAVDNLKKEGFENFPAQIVRSGDVMLDAALFYRQFSQKPEVADLPDKYILATVHRAENTDDPQRLRGIFEALVEISKEIPVVLPVHPRTKNILEKEELNFTDTGLTLIDPVGYLQMIWLLEHCSMVMTDSGGLQKEAYFFKKYCITLRDETEWVELIEADVNQLAGAEKTKILTLFSQYWKTQPTFPTNLYGQGDSAKEIVRQLFLHCE
jgi:UDP-GlcNAc3NAcA epimerase